MNKVQLIILFLLSILQISSCQNITKKDIESDIEVTSDVSEVLNLPFDYIVVSGEDALEKCLKLREENKGKITPVILGKYEDVKMQVEVASYEQETSKEIIDQSENYDAESLLKQRKDDDPEAYNYVELGDWPEILSPMTSITSNKDLLTGAYIDKVYIGLIPTEKSYEVPAYIKFGGWNSCPSPAEQVAILRYWYFQYGAQVISITSDIIECTVENPPETKEESIDLANEQFLYCSDIVLQGTGTISELAGSLYKSDYWFFWWD